MPEKRESTMQARVFHHGPGPLGTRRHHDQGWYYQFEGDDPVGPFAAEIEAGKAARATIITAAERAEAASRADPCPGPDSCFKRVDERADGATRLADRCEGCPDKAGNRRRYSDRRGDLDPSHFAGSDRRMRERRGPDWPALAEGSGDHHLDRVDGRNKYAVINMRLARTVIHNGRDPVRANAVEQALSTLRHYEVLNDGEPGAPGEFFVLMLKDQFADLALLRYADAARAAGMGEYADDVLQLVTRAGHGSPWCKRPD